MRAENQYLKDEIARLMGHPPRPKFKTKPSGMEKATSRSKRAKAGKERRGSVKEKLAVTSEVKLKVEAPAGSRFKGYEDVFVQDLQIRVAVVRYRRERWETKNGERIIAPLPQGILGGFGPELRRFIAADILRILTGALSAPASMVADNSRLVRGARAMGARPRARPRRVVTG